MRQLIDLVKKALKYLPKSDRKKLLRIVPIFVSLSLLDLLGVVLLGTVATLTFNVISNDNKPTRLELIFQSLLPHEMSRTSLILTLSIIAVCLLTSKTIVQAFFAYRFAKFQARLETEIASTLYNSMLCASVLKVNQNKYSDYQYSLMVGANRYVAGIIGSTILFVSDLFTTLLMLMFAFYASPLSATIILAVFATTYFAFNGPINSRAKRYGRLSYLSHRNIGEDLLESLRGIKEIKAYSKEEMYKELFRKEKTSSSLINQKIVWLNSLIRYFLEISILLSGSLITVGLIITSDLKHAITVSAIFIAIGFRLIPNIQRLQNSINSLRISSESTKTLFLFLEQFKNQSKVHQPRIDTSFVELEAISVKNLFFSYVDGTHVLKDISFEHKANQTLAIIGDSGSGKSTLIDLISGLYDQTSGSIKFLSLPDKSENRAGSFPISYITQYCALFGKNLYQNISLTQELTFGEKDRIDGIIESLNLNEFVNLDTGGSREIRADSTNVSGGERQRISIARAKFFDTDIVILDEPTSALDIDNEKKVIEYLSDISHRKTVIVVTHSRDLLEIADAVLYLDGGSLLFFGTVSEYKVWEKDRK